MLVINYIDIFIFILSSNKKVLLIPIFNLRGAAMGIAR
jgi:hypothetical protein